MIRGLWAVAAGLALVAIALAVAWLRGRRRTFELAMQLDSARRIYELGNDAILIVDLVDGRLILANGAATKLLGFSPVELTRRTLADLHPRHLVTWSASVLADVWEQKGLVYSDIPFVRADGELIDVEVSASIVDYQGRPAALLYARDIRERLRLEARVREQNEELERLNHEIKDLFGRYVSGEVRDAILAGQDMLGGREMEVSVLFCDLRDFTALSSTMSAHDLVDLLNRYFTTMVAAITEQRGVVDKFIGDAVMAVFGAPQKDESHALHAVLAARGMMRRLRDFNIEQKKRGMPELRIGIGIASGKVVAGNLGSELRKSYTVVGDTVNLASRIESLTKNLAPVLLNEEAAKMVRMQFELRAFPDVAVRGLRETVTLYAPPPEEGDVYLPQQIIMAPSPVQGSRKG
jgi:PAS domain S-box-containing protein